MFDGITKLKRITSMQKVEPCKKLLESALGEGDKFISHILQDYFNDSPDIMQVISFENFRNKLSDSEYLSIPPVPHSEDLWNVLKHISPVQAGKPETWLSVTLQAVQNGIIEPHFLARNTNNTGKQEIQNALESSSGSHKNTPLWLKVSRRILRHAFGSISERGRKGIFTEVPFATAWWKIHLSHEISKDTDLSYEDIVKWMFKQSTNYAELAMRMSGRLTVVADESIRNGIFLFLLRSCEGKHIDTDQFKELMKHIGIITSWCALGALSAEKVSTIIKSFFQDIDVTKNEHREH